MTITLVDSGSDGTPGDAPYFDFVIPGTAQKGDVLVAVFDVGYPHTIDTLFCDEIGISSGPLAADQAGLLYYTFGDTIPSSWHFYWSLTDGPILVSWALYRSSEAFHIIDTNVVSDTSDQNTAGPFGPDDDIPSPIFGREYVYAIGYTEPNGTVSIPSAPVDMVGPGSFTSSSILNYTEVATDFLFTYGAMLCGETYSGGENVAATRYWSGPPYCKGYHTWILELNEVPDPAAGSIQGIRVASSMINVYTITDRKSNHNSMLFKYQWGTGVGHLMAGHDVGEDIFEYATDLTTDSYNDDVFVLSNKISMLGSTIRRVTDSGVVSVVADIPGTSTGLSMVGDYIGSVSIDARSYSDKSCDLWVALRRITYTSPGIYSVDDFEIWKISTADNWATSTQEKMITLTSMQVKDIAVSSTDNVYVLFGDGMAVYKFPPSQTYTVDWGTIGEYVLPSFNTFTDISVEYISVDDKDAVYGSATYHSGGGG